MFSILPKDSSCDGQHPKVVYGAFLIGGGNASELVQPIDQPLHNVPLPIASLVEAPSSLLPLLASDTAPIPRLHKYGCIFLLLYPLSPTTRSGRMRGFPCPTRLTGPVSINVLKTVCSCRCPAVISRAIGFPPPSATQVDFRTEASLTPS